MLHFTCVYLSTHISFLSVDMTFLKSCRCLRSTLCEIQKKQKKKEQQHILSVRESGAYFLVCAGKHDAAAAPLAVTGSTSKSLLKAELQCSTDSFNSVWIQHDWKWQHILLLALKLKVKHRRVESLCGIQRRRRRGGGALQTLHCLHWMLMLGEAAAHSHQSVWKHTPECVSDSTQSCFHTHKHAAIRRHWVHETPPPINPPPNPHTDPTQ